jgi:gliding motility-associated-like protein
MMFKVHSFLMLCCTILVNVHIAGQQVKTDTVCYGQSRHYYVDPNPGSNYIWWIDGVAQIGFTANEFDHIWDSSGIFLLEVLEQSEYGCPGNRQTENVFVLPGPKVSKSLSDFNGFNISCSGFSNGKIILTPLSGPDPFSFRWHGPDGFSTASKDISGLVAGQYTVSITDKNGCSSVDTIKLVEPDPLKISYKTSVSSDGQYNISCAGTNTGTINVLTENGVGRVDYLWNDGFKGSERANMTAGTYKIIVTDSNNCQSESEITLIEPDMLKVASVIIEPFCPGTENGAITLNVTGGVHENDYKFKWSNNSTGKDLSNIAEGIYKVTVTDLNNCAKSDSVYLNSKNSSCLSIPEAISPNGDLINDDWIIGNSNIYPEMVITIYNRWGQPVWRSEPGYPCPWNGTSNGKRLPVDSYHYIIILHNGQKAINGSVTIVR